MLKKLQTLCEIKSLDTRGTEDQLLKRLGIEDEDSLTRMLSFKSESQEESDTRLIPESEIGDKECIKRNPGIGPKDRWEEGAFKGCDEMELGKTPPGNQYCRTLTGLPTRIKLLEERVALLEMQSMVDESNIASLEAHLSDLTTAIADDRLRHNCFISLFKRDKLNRMTEDDKKIIEIEGGDSGTNGLGGDAMVDAQLYIGVNGRRDYYEFRQLYGFLPETVLTFSELSLRLLVLGKF